MKKLSMLLVLLTVATPALCQEPQKFDFFGIRAKSDENLSLKIKSVSVHEDGQYYDLGYESYKMDENFLTAGRINGNKIGLSIINKSSVPIQLSHLSGTFKLTTNEGKTYVLQESPSLNLAKSLTSDSYLNPDEQVDFVLDIPKSLNGITKNDVKNIFIEFPNLYPDKENYDNLHQIYFYLVPTP